MLQDVSVVTIWSNSIASAFSHVASFKIRYQLFAVIVVFVTVIEK
jgi:hypothetical protein